MNFFIDTEFLEGAQVERFPFSWFRKNTLPTIELISIGIVTDELNQYLNSIAKLSQDSYYAVCKDFNLKEAWNRYQMKEVYGDQRNRFPKGIREYWIRENVLKPIFESFLELETEYLEKQLRMIGYAPKLNDEFNYSNFKRLLKKYGKSKTEIAKEVKKFVYHYSGIHDPVTISNWNEVKHLFPVNFYGYYADYDWVVFCWLFGKMIDLPTGFPMYCRDLKQMFDDKAMSFTDEEFIKKFKFSKTPTLEKRLSVIKKEYNYPKETNEHHALADANWNKKLYQFIKSL